ncbi:Mrt4p [Sugiyamaella lignohabitans]|uniref:Ribosome assembly factor mrt4 n=1 Tax=Sugiyamaella lignohabitans TaxID=796027 RepID=A0A167CYL2_9ASCO|nr:Mrt4p [Sugiyamaella lignohabitans]ANB12262.1 Mrt4p [Sugiyamaella lignohabitans]
MRNTFLKTIRQDWKGSKILFGRTRVMQKALGRTPEEEHRENLAQLTKHMSGDVGLLMTDEEPQVVRDYFESFVKSDFARAGIVAPLTFTIPAGIVYSRGGQIPAEDDVPLAHSLESTIRSLGVPTQLKAGKVVLSGDHTVCTEGQVLDGKQTRLLKQFGIACSEFKIVLVAYYDREASEVQTE